MIKLNITQSGPEIYQDVKVKSSRSLKRLLERQNLSILGLNYDIRVDDVGVTASLRSQDSMIKILEPILLVLHKTVRYILNAIYAGCSFHKAMYMSQRTIGKLCGIGPDQAHRIIQLLWKLGFFIKRRRYHTPGSPWLSCQYKMPKWLFKSKIRNYFSSVLPALGDKIRWHGELCPMHVSAKLMILLLLPSCSLRRNTRVSPRGNK